MAKADNDKYYTPQSTIEKCVEIMKEHIKKPVKLFIEPCAGDGRWYAPLSTMGERVDLYDLEPDEGSQHPITQMDFLTGKLDNAHSECTVIVTNPPFGKSNSLANKIFNRAAEYEPDYICFLVPETFGIKKAGSLSDQYTLLKSEPLPSLHFERPDGHVYEGAESSLQCTFQVWEKKPRDKEEPLKGDVRMIEKDGKKYRMTTYQGDGFKLLRPGNHKDEEKKERPVVERGLLDEYAKTGLLVTITTHGTLYGKVADFNPYKDKVSVRQFILAESKEILDRIMQLKPEDFNVKSALKHNPSINSEEIVKTLNKLLAEENQ